MHVHSPQRVLELPRTRTESGHASQQLHYERRAASAAILAAAALAIAVAVAARLSLDNAAASAASAAATAASAATYSPQCVSA